MFRYVILAAVFQIACYIDHVKEMISVHTIMVGRTLSNLARVSYTNKQYSVVFAWHVGKAVYCCACAVQ